MRILDLTLPTHAENLALDEALLEAAESSTSPGETLRLWEPASPLVVVGRSSQVSAEVHETECQVRGIPILRRASGGASIVAGPGCLMYAVLLSYELRPELRSIDRVHALVLDTIVSSLAGLVPGVARRGTSDLTIGDRKFSGNSLRCKKRLLLYHGTLLYNFPLDLVERCLNMPPRVPDYRAGREHGDFITNLPVSRDTLARALRNAWKAEEVDQNPPRELVRELVAGKYSLSEWNYQR